MLTLSPAQFAVGFDMHLVGGGAVLLTDGTTATVTVYDDSAALVATQDVATGGFFGVRSDTPIATVKIFRNGTYAEGIDNLVFGPAFSSVTPATGGYRGGSSVTLTGAGLAASTTVTFDGVPATDIVVTGGTSLTCKAPAHAAGTVDVVLQTSGVSLTRASSFTYAAHSATVALTLTPKSPRYPDEPNAFTATVTGTDPQGTVTLMEGATELAQGSLASGTADFSVLLGVGTHNVFARYKGDPFHAEASSSETTVDVVEHPPPALDAGLGDGGGAPLNPSDDAGAGGAANGGATESGCATSSESPRTPLGFAAALVTLVALAFVRRRSR